jgi:hypothetical protein
MVFFMVGLFGMRQSEIFAKLQRQPEILEWNGGGTLPNG